MTDLATRYGRPAPARRRAIYVATAVVAALFVAWVAWAAVEHGDPAATSRMVGFDVVDQHTATATFTVSRRTPEVEASCLLRAQSPDHATVGELNVPVGPGGPLEQTITETVRTEREATTVDIVGCVADGQIRRR